LTASKNAAVAPVVQVKAEKVVQKKEEVGVILRLSLQRIVIVNV